MRSKPTVSTQFAKMLLHFCAEQGVDIDDLTQSVALDSRVLDEPEERIDYAVFSRLFSAAEERCGLKNFGVQLGKRAVDYSSGHILISMMRSCATFEGAMTRMLRYHSLVSDAFSFEVTSQGNSLVVTLTEDEYLPQLPPSEAEQIFTMLVLLLESLTRPSIRPDRIFFIHSKPGDVSGYSAIQGGRISFGQQHNQLWFDAKQLRRRLPMADPEFQQTIEQLVERRIRERTTATPWTTRAERQLYRTLSKGEVPGFDLLAKELGLSGKTLRRYLGSEGTTYKNVLDSVREEMAKVLNSVVFPGTQGGPLMHVIAAKAVAFGEAQTCSGGESGCGGHEHHHHREPETVPIVGKADIREGRMVTIEYELKDADGTMLNNSAADGPMRFIFGKGQILPAIEKSLAGLGLTLGEIAAARLKP